MAWMNFTICENTRQYRNKESYCCCYHHSQIHWNGFWEGDWNGTGDTYIPLRWQQDWWAQGCCREWQIEPLTGRSTLGPRLHSHILGGWENKKENERREGGREWWEGQKVRRKGVKEWSRLRVEVGRGGVITSSCPLVSWGWTGERPLWLVNLARSTNSYLSCWASRSGHRQNLE